VLYVPKALPMGKQLFGKTGKKGNLKDICFKKRRNSKLQADTNGIESNEKKDSVA
jgi:hypothetical protein